MILEPGSFRVKKYRKPFPVRLIKQLSFEAGRDGLLPQNTDMGDVEFDHDPALTLRPYDTAVGDFIPAQHDEEYIVLRLKADHLHKTTGRKPGAERTVHNRGSDRGEAKHMKLVRGTQEMHEVKIAAKVEDNTLLRQVLCVEKKPKPKRKWPSRPFQKKQRPLKNTG